MKKLIGLLFVLIFGFLSVNAEETDPNEFVKDYGKYVQKIIKSNLNYKGEESASVVISYEINPDGTVENITLEEKSGTPFDEAVISAVEKSAPFKAFPEDLNISSISMKSGFQHVVQRYQTTVPVNQTGIKQPSQLTRIALTPVQPPFEVQQAYNAYTHRLNKFFFDRIPTVYNYVPKEPKIKCIILKDGTIKSVEIEQSSGIDEYDKKLVETYSKLKVEPFPSILAEYFSEIPYSATMIRQFRSNPTFRNTGFNFR